MLFILGWILRVCWLKFDEWNWLIWYFIFYECVKMGNIGFDCFVGGVGKGELDCVFIGFICMECFVGYEGDMMVLNSFC